MRWLVAALVLALGGVSQASGQTTGESPAENIEDLKALAESGNEYAQHRLAFVYVWGSEGVPKDEYLGFYWFRRAAEQGNSAAQGQLGYRYEHGDGTVQQDIQKAIYWYRLGADGRGDFAGFEDPISAWRLGVINFEGKGIQKDLPAAYWWFRKAAELGLHHAQFALARMYEEGTGVGRDLDEAVRWYRKAAEQGHEEAQDALNRLDK